MNNKFEIDYEKMMHKHWTFWGGAVTLFRNMTVRFLWTGRMRENAKNPICKAILDLLLHYYKDAHGVSIPFYNTGAGLTLAYPHSIIVNGGVKLGNDVTLFKGVLIGSVKSGRLAGVPTIGNHVVICSNSTIVGNVHIGDDVLIAANAFVNFDVPDHSIVIGNPGQVHYKKNAAADYCDYNI